MRILEAIREKNLELEEARGSVRSSSSLSHAATVTEAEALAGEALYENKAMNKDSDLIADSIVQLYADGNVTHEMVNSLSTSPVIIAPSHHHPPIMAADDYSKSNIHLKDSNSKHLHGEESKHLSGIATTSRGKFSFDFPGFEFFFGGKKDKDKNFYSNESEIVEHDVSGSREAFAAGAHTPSTSPSFTSTSMKSSSAVSAFTNDAYGGGGGFSMEDVETKSATAFLLYSSSKKATDKNDIFSPLTNKLSTIGVAAAAVALSAAGLHTEVGSAAGEAFGMANYMELIKEITTIGSTIAAESSGGGALGFILGPMAVFTAVPSAIAVKVWRSKTDEADKKEKDAIMSIRISEKLRINEEKKMIEEEREKMVQLQIKEKEIKKRKAHEKEQDKILQGKLEVDWQKAKDSEGLTTELRETVNEIKSEQKIDDKLREEILIKNEEGTVRMEGKKNEQSENK